MASPAEKPVDYAVCTKRAFGYGHYRPVSDFRVWGVLAFYWRSIYYIILLNCYRNATEFVCKWHSVAIYIYIF